MAMCKKCSVLIDIIYFSLFLYCSGLAGFVYVSIIIKF